jgi:uncharacterized membrane protein YphA (DoxX/SURF4 family)
MSSTSNKFWRNFLRVLAALALLFQLVFSIIIPKVQAKPVYLDTNDGYIIIGAIALLISIEAVKAAVDKWVNSKSK